MYRVTVARNKTMQEVDKGVSNTVTAIAVHEPSGIIYMGGLFLDATGVSVRYVTAWDGINWDQMGGGIGNPTVCKLDHGGIIQGEEPVVYALQLMGGTDKAAPTEGTSVPPSLYGTEKERAKVFVGGRFRRAGQGEHEVVAHHIAMWDPAAADGQGRWSALCNPSPPTRCNQGGIGEGEDRHGDIGRLEFVYALALDEPRQRLFVGGIFESAGQVFDPIESLAVYDLKTMAWKRVGLGLSGPNVVIHSLLISSNDPEKLYVAGSFQVVDKQNEDIFLSGKVSHSVARFALKTDSWEALATGIPDAVVRTVAVTKDKKVYVGGDIASVNGQPAGGIAFFDGAAWSTLGSGAINEDGTPARIYKVIAVDQDVGEILSNRILESSARSLQLSLHTISFVVVAAIVYSCS